MPIQEQNIVFVESQVMDDVPEGGGAATGLVIPDGVMNNVFEDISDLDRAYGRFNLRKLFLAVRALNTDLYGGAKTVITALPTDPALGYTLFTTNAPFDTRVEAAARVEAYLYKGPMWHGALHENHITGMRAISVIQRVNTALPPIGKTLCLVQDEGLPGQKEQYVRIIKVEAVPTTLEDADGEFVRWVVRMDLSDALRYDFLGHSAGRYDSYNYTGKTRIRDTTVADATRYYGSQRLADAASIGDLTVNAASLFAQLVPSAQTETPLISQVLAAEKAPLLASRASSLSYTVAGAVIAPNGRFVLNTGAVPGSISVTVGSVVITDNGLGNAMQSGVLIGLWDYATGECRFNSSAPSASGSANVTYTPATAAAQQAHTRAVVVTPENRRLNWIETLLPIPAPGVLDIAYRAQGNWYVLRDNGAGAISGSDVTFGSGTVSFVTGDAAITLGALPDAGSQIIYTWASPVHTTIHTDDASAIVRCSVALTETPINPGSVTVTWHAGGTTRTLTDSAGVLSGTNAGGTVDYGGGVLSLTFARLPDRATGLSVAYQSLEETSPEDPLLVAGTLTLNPASTSFTLGRAVTPGSVKLSAVPIQWLYEDTPVGSLFFVDLVDGADGLLYASHTTVYDGYWGTVNYATGAIVIVRQRDASFWYWEYGTSTWVVTAPDYQVAAYTPFGYQILDAGYGTPTVRTQSFTSSAAPLLVDLTATIQEPLVAQSVRFRLGGLVYVDRNGTLYANPSPATGSGTVAGTLNYDTGQATLTFWTDNALVDLTLDSLLTRHGDWTAIDACFRTAASPVKPEALSVVAVTTDGVQITGVADEDGVIAGSWMRGAINYEFGTAWLEFGYLDGATWVSRAVDPGTIRYNAVAYSYIPLDANILGIDAVRLPSDGRVPIYRSGDVVMILHAAETTGTPSYAVETNTYRLSCGRTRIAYVKITDDAGDPVTEGYTLDRAAGVVSWVSLAGLDTPVTIKHTVGDLRLVTDAQINGTLTLARPLSHEFPADDSLVAACLIHGDRRARVSAVWDQASWDGTWKDSIVGSAATATLNTIDFPITVTNEGCDTDRWLLRWTSTTAVELISEKRGLVWTGSYPAYVSGTPADIAPINPRTRDENGLNGTPYVTIPQKANGGGWSAGNVVRINTVGAIADFWVARAILQSDEPDDDGADGCEIYALGNIDRP
ncbi:MAG TPA: hypothetical protein PLC99_22395 [Verrucomicrobiota bacterium]|nr:hypothetical protein [Verrucomicrobiota bacterium]